MYPFQSHYLAIGGQRMHYVDEGAGPTVVMLHGNPTWSFYFRHAIKALAGDYRVIAPDHIGCGLSEKPQRYPYTLEQHIENLEKLADHLELDDITLMVHDWGGPIGFGYAARHPDKIRRLAISNTAAFRGRAPRRILACRIPLLGALAVRTFNGFAGGATRLACHKRERMTPEVRRGYLLPYDNYRNRVAVHGFVLDIPTRPTHPTYRLIEEISASLGQFRDRPMSIFWGVQDFCFNETYLDRWIERFPNAAVHRFEDAGHYVLEDAHEFIVPELRKFLDETS
jgi:haloalkane dehalogenase